MPKPLELNRYFVTAAVLLTLPACRSWTVQAPPRTTAGAPVHAVQESSIAIPVLVGAEALRAAVEQELKRGPLAKDETPETSLRVLLNEETVLQKPRRVIEVPYKAAFCQTQRIAEQVKERVKTGERMVSCLIKPWKWGKCAEDVLEDVWRTVYRDVTKCFPEQLEVVRMVMEPFVEVKELVAPTNASLRYRADLNKLGMSFTGNRVRLEPEARVTVDLDVRQGVLGSNLKVRGAVQCKSDVTPTVDASLSLVQDGRAVRPKVDVNDVHLDFARVCVPGAVEALEVAQLLNPVAGLIGTQVGNVIDAQLRKMLDGQVDDALGSVDLTRQLQDIGRVLQRPVRIADDMWLIPHATGVTVSQVEGRVERGQDVVAINGALTARPEVWYGSVPPTDTQPLAISLGTTGDRFELHPRGVIPLDVASHKLDSLLRSFVLAQRPKYRKVTSKVEVYQSTDRIVFGVALGNVGPFRSSGTLYLSGIPHFDASTRRLGFRDLKFDVATREFLVSKAAWMLDKPIEAILERELKIELGDQLDRTLRQIEVFADTSVAGVLSGRVERLELGDIWLEDGKLNLTIRATGTSRFEAAVPRLSASATP